MNDDYDCIEGDTQSPMHSCGHPDFTVLGRVKSKPNWLTVSIFLKLQGLTGWQKGNWQDCGHG